MICLSVDDDPCGGGVLPQMTLSDNVLSVRGLMLGRQRSLAARSRDDGRSAGQRWQISSLQPPDPVTSCSQSGTISEPSSELGAVRSSVAGATPAGAVALIDDFLSDSDRAGQRTGSARRPTGAERAQ